MIVVFMINQMPNRTDVALARKSPTMAISKRARGIAAIGNEREGEGFA